MSASSFRVRSVLYVVLGIFATPRVEAQDLGGHRIGLTQPASQVVDREAAIEKLRAPHRSYWREGGVVTALAAVIVVNIMASADGDSGGKVSIGDRVLYSALSGVVFFVPGALIGGLIPKK